MKTWSVFGFILNYEYFMRQVGGVERFKRIMVWLPTWQDARQILQTLGVADEEIASELRTRNSIESQRELLDLYDLIATRLVDCEKPITTGRHACHEESRH